MNIIDWHNPINSKKYAEYCENNNLYSKSGEFLVELAAIQDGEVILDLACGTGAATKTIVRQSNETNLIFGIDYSAAQISEAKTKPWPPTVKFLQAEIKDLPTLIKVKVDVVICNCAFWFLDIPLLLKVLDQIGSPKCRIAFNVFGDPLPRHQKSNQHNDSDQPNLISLAKDIAIKKYNYIAPESAPSDSWYERSPADYVEWFEASPFHITCLKSRLVESDKFSGLSAWWQIPVFLTSHLPGLEYEQALSVIKEAQILLTQLKPEEFRTKGAEFSWAYLAERVPSNHKY